MAKNISTCTQRSLQAVGTAAALALLSPLVATAQGAAPVVQEVVVSAERTDSALRRTPVSEGVVDRQQIDAQGIYQLNDLVGVIAGVTVPNGYSNMPQAVGIRGVGVSNPAMSQAVGIYLDDVPLVRGYATALWDLPDITRIEVLRGPQGTLYGQSSSAGAVKLVSADPGADRSAWASMGAGNYGARELHGFVSGGLGPANDGLSGSFAISRRSNDGFGYNATQDKRVNKLDATQFRAKLRERFTPDVSVVLALDGLQDRSDTNTINFPLNHAGAAPRVTWTSSDAGAFKRNAGGVSLKLEDKVGPGATLRAITAWRMYDDDPTVADWSGLEVERYEIAQTVKQKTFSQELQAQGKDRAWSWTTGLMLVDDRFDFDRFTTSFALTRPAPATTEALTHQHTVDLGLYGQARYELTADTGVTFGARAWRTRQTGSNALWKASGDFQRTAVIYDAEGLSTKRSGVVPRLGVESQLDADTFVYANVAQGAKFGGFNRAASSQLSASVASDPEKVVAYEAGAKASWMGGALTANAAAFFNDYRDYLAALSNLTINGVLVTDAVLVNAGRARTWGVDLDFNARVASNVHWKTSIEWLGSRIAAFQNPTGAPAADYVGNELPYAPHLSLGSTLANQVALSGGSAVALDGSVQYLTKQYGDLANSQTLKTPSQTIVNLGIGWLAPERHWSVSLRVRNVFDRTIALSHNVIPPFGLDTAYYNAPRTIVATVRFDD
jgi:iron complex outermembrane recepter protein